MRSGEAAGKIYLYGYTDHRVDRVANPSPVAGDVDACVQGLDENLAGPATRQAVPARQLRQTLLPLGAR